MQLPITVGTEIMTSSHAVYRDESGKPRAAVKMVSARRYTAGEHDGPPLLERAAEGDADIITLHRADHEAWLERHAKISKSSEAPPLSAREVYRLDPVGSFQQQDSNTVDLRDPLSLYREEVGIKELPKHDRLRSILLMQITAGSIRAGIIAKFHPDNPATRHPAYVNRTLQQFSLTYRPVAESAPGSPFEQKIQLLAKRHATFIEQDRTYEQQILAQEWLGDKAKLGEQVKHVFAATREHLTAYVDVLGKHASSIGQDVAEDYAKTGITTASLLAEMSLIAEQRFFAYNPVDREYVTVRAQAAQIHHVAEVERERLAMIAKRKHEAEQMQVQNLRNEAHNVTGDDREAVIRETFFQRARAVFDRIEVLAGGFTMPKFTQEDHDAYNSRALSKEQRSEILAREKYFLAWYDIARDFNAALEKNEPADRILGAINRQYENLMDWASRAGEEAGKTAGQIKEDVQTDLMTARQTFDDDTKKFAHDMELVGFSAPSDEELRASVQQNVAAEVVGDIKMRLRIDKISDRLDNAAKATYKEQHAWKALQEWDIIAKRRSHQRLLLEQWSATYGPESKERFFDALALDDDDEFHDASDQLAEVAA